MQAFETGKLLYARLQSFLNMLTDLKDYTTDATEWSYTMIIYAFIGLLVSFMICTNVLVPCADIWVRLAETCVRCRRANPAQKLPDLALSQELSLIKTND